VAGESWYSTAAVAVATVRLGGAAAAHLARFSARGRLRVTVLVAIAGRKIIYKVIVKALYRTNIKSQSKREYM